VEQASAAGTPGRYGVEHARKKLVQRCPHTAAPRLDVELKCAMLGLPDIQLLRILGMPNLNPSLAEFGWQSS
jgi:hypothetical protein